MNILGIESTCDETGASVVQDGRKVLSNVVASSVDLQKKYGGVVPEVAAREQIKVIIPVINEALVKAFEVGSGEMDKKKLHTSSRYPHSHIQRLVSKIDAIAVSHGPGLTGSLLIGVETAKTLALVWNKPLIPVNHLVGHIYASWISLHKIPQFPLMGLVVSGGHTDLVLMRKHGDFKLIGTTLDDSAGEAYDKVARFLGLKYPGGPEVERAAQQLTADKKQLTLKFPRPMINSNDFNFSFSGLKTAVVSYVSQLSNVKSQRSAIAAEFQKAVTDVLVKKTIEAANKYDCRTIVVGGGVSANTLLRSQLTDYGSRLSKKIYFPSKILSVDNGAMIASAAFYLKNKIDPMKLQADSALHF